VSPVLTDIPLGSGAVPTGRLVSTGELDARVVRLSARELVVRRPSTTRFAAVGVTWAPDRSVGAVRVELRHRLGTGRWSGWSTVEQGDAGPDPAVRPGSRDGTDPVWTGTSTGVEARVSPVSGSAPRDVRLTLVDPRDSAADATATPLATGAPSVGEVPSAGGGPTALASAPRPAIYTRAQWGADPSLMTWDPEYAPRLKAGFLHHTVDSNAYAPADVPRILRAIYAFHSRSRGWGDIGYNFVVDRFGRTWEGRYGGVDSTVIGAHTGGFNAGTFGVAMLGTYSTTPVPAATVGSLSAVFAWKLARWNLDPYGTARLTSSGGGTSRYAAGTVVTKNVISGHRDVGSTSCPGDRGYAQLPTIRRSVASRITTAGLVSPAVSPTSVPYAASTGPRITAGLSGSSAWTVTVTRDCPAGPTRRWSGTGGQVDTRWDLRDSAGQPARPGTYAVSLAPTADGSGTRYTATVTVRPPTGTPALAAGALPRAGTAGFVPVASVRVLDTRTTLGDAGGLPLGGGRRVDVPVLGVGGVPASGVAAVLVSATGFCSTAAGPLTLWPAGTARPGTTAVSVTRAPGTSAALAAVRVGAGGKVSVAGGGGSTDAALDVVGWLPLSGGAGFHPVPGTRVLDTVLDPGQTREVPVGAVPPGATAVLANAAVVGPSAPGHLRVWAAGSPRPAAASVTFVAGVTGSDRVVVPLAGGEVALHNQSTGSARVVLDVTGWYGEAGARFTAVVPSRLALGTLPRDAVAAVPVTGRAGLPAAGVAAVVGTLSVRPSARTWVAAWPSGGRPPTADLHAEAGGWESTLLVVPAGTDGKVRFYSAGGDATAVLDVVGYYR